MRELARADIDPQRGAAGILQQIRQLGGALVRAHRVTRVGIRFWRPGRHEPGTRDQEPSGAGLGELSSRQLVPRASRRPRHPGQRLRRGHAWRRRISGQGRAAAACSSSPSAPASVAGFVHDGRLLGTGRPAACEIGHLRPGLHAVEPDQTVESLASGWGIAAAAQARLAGEVTGTLTSLAGPRSPARIAPSCSSDWPTRNMPMPSRSTTCWSAATRTSIN